MFGNIFTELRTSINTKLFIILKYLINVIKHYGKFSRNLGHKKTLRHVSPQNPRNSPHLCHFPLV